MRAAIHPPPLVPSSVATTFVHCHRRRQATIIRQHRAPEPILQRQPALHHFHCPYHPFAPSSSASQPCATTTTIHAFLRHCLQHRHC